MAGFKSATHPRRESVNFRDKGQEITFEKALTPQRPKPIRANRSLEARLLLSDCVPKTAKGSETEIQREQGETYEDRTEDS